LSSISWDAQIEREETRLRYGVNLPGAKRNIGVCQISRPMRA